MQRHKMMDAFYKFRILTSPGFSSSVRQIYSAKLHLPPHPSLKEGGGLGPDLSHLLVHAEHGLDVGAPAGRSLLHLA